ncbi:MAG: IS3 family transposase [Polyangiales bacterium]
MARDPIIPLSHACDVLGMPRGTARRRLAPRRHGPRRPRPPSPRRLTPEERQQVLTALHSERFEDQTPRQVYAELLDEGSYLASPSTMYRILAERGESRERRNQREARSHAVPRLEARAPNQVWTWDISKLATTTPGKFLNLYLVLDLYSRYPVAWMVAEHENSALAKQLFATAIERYDIAPGTITVHNDRGAPMTATGFIDLLAELRVDRSLSRPRVSNDNPFSESCFKTIKYQPDYPGRFRDVEHARRWFAEFFEWYANHHRHSGLALFTPADVFFGRVEGIVEVRQAALDGGYARHPERFVKGPPRVRRPPAVVSINPLDPTAPKSLEKLLRSGDAEFMAPNPTPASAPQPVLPGAPATTANPT